MLGFVSNTDSKVFIGVVTVNLTAVASTLIYPGSKSVPLEICDNAMTKYLNFMVIFHYQLPTQFKI